MSQISRKQQHNHHNSNNKSSRCHKQMTEIIKKEIVTLPQVKEILESVKAR